MKKYCRGLERRSNKELKRFLFIAKGSCAEVRSMLYLAHSLNYLSKEKHDRLVEQATEISKVFQVLLVRSKSRLSTL